MLCPRCEVRELKNELALNALSRTTRGENDVSVYVCSPCGSNEGLNEYFDGDTEPQSEWPVVGARYEMPKGVVF